MAKSKMFVAVVWYAEHVKANQYTPTVYGTATAKTEKRAAAFAWKNAAKNSKGVTSPELFERGIRLENQDGVTLIFEDGYLGLSDGPDFPVGVVKEK